MTAKVNDSSIDTEKIPKKIEVIENPEITKQYHNIISDKVCNINKETQVLNQELLVINETKRLTSNEKKTMRTKIYNKKYKQRKRA